MLSNAKALVTNSNKVYWQRGKTMARQTRRQWLENQIGWLLKKPVHLVYLS